MRIDIDNVTCNKHGKKREKIYILSHKNIAEKKKKLTFFSVFYVFFLFLLHVSSISSMTTQICILFCCVLCIIVYLRFCC